MSVLDDDVLQAIRRLPGWVVAWEGHGRRFIASHPDRSTGLQVVGDTVDELVERVDRYLKRSRFTLESP